jgi:hypothetical protein
MPTRAAQRWDNGTLSEPVETAEGFLLVEGVLTRAGIFEYKKPDGTVRRELRDDAEVTSPASLATLLGRPATLLHPVEDGKRVLVTPQNYSTFAAGSVVAPRVEEADGVPLVAAPLLWTRADALEAIRAGVRELSCGYECDLDETPGVHPIYGPYDAKQTGIVYNHVAAVPHGRAGRVAAMRLDAAEQQPTTEVEMPTDQKTDEGAAPMFDAAKMDAYMGKMDAYMGKMDAILAKLMPAEGGEVEVEDAAKMDAADVVAYGNRRVELVATAKRLGIKHDAADDNNKIARAIATKHLGTLRADASDAYVDAVVDVASLNASAEATRKIGQQAAQTRHDSAAPTTQDYHAKLRANMRGTATKEG